MKFDWHSGNIALETPIDKNFRITPKVRRFLNSHLAKPITTGPAFRAWLTQQSFETMNNLVIALKERAK